jgi:hypothetical protein
LADYQKWQTVIQDTNDSDGDGVLDLSDPPQSKAMPWIQRLGKSAIPAIENMYQLLDFLVIT